MLDIHAIIAGYGETQILRGVTLNVNAGEIVAVLGANGNRDTSKRRMMGRFAAMFADVLVVTDDNPYDDDPAEIRAMFIDGARSSASEIIEIGDLSEIEKMALRKSLKTLGSRCFGIHGARKDGT